MRTAPRRLGLLGGLTWESSLLYERLLNEGTRAALGGVASADLVLRSYNFQTMADAQAAGDWDGMGRTLAADALALEAAGAEAILICANTMHKVANYVTDAISVPLIHVIDATADAILAAGIDTVALLGTGYTMRDPFYRDHMALRGVTTIAPAEPDLSRVHDVIYSELAKGVVNDASRGYYVEVIDGLVAQGAAGVIAGCTEIPLLITQEHVSQPYFNSLTLHVDAALAFSLKD